METSAKSIISADWIKRTLIAILVIFPLGQFSTIPFLPASIHAYLHDFLILILWMILLPILLKTMPKIWLKPILVPGICFLIFAFISLLLNLKQLAPSQFIVSLLYLIRLISYSGIYIGLHIIGRNIDSRKLFRKMMVISAVVMAIAGIFQYYLYPDLRNLYYLGWDPHYLRLFSTVLDPGFAGLIFVLGLTALMFGNIYDNKRVYLILSLSLAFSLMLTYSRSSFVALAGGISFFIWVKKKARYALIAALVFILCFLLIPRSNKSEGLNLDRMSTVISRLQNWQESFKFMQKSPVYGYGFNTLKFTRPQPQIQKFQNAEIPNHSEGGVENSYLFVLLTTGIIGLGIFLWFVWNCFQSGDSLIRATIIAIAIHALFNNSWFYPWTMIWFWFTLGTDSEKMRHR